MKYILINWTNSEIPLTDERKLLRFWVSALIWDKNIFQIFKFLIY